jgi:hypothetical protein
MTENESNLTHGFMTALELLMSEKENAVGRKSVAADMSTGEDRF